MHYPTPINWSYNMVFNAPIIAISLSQPNSSHSINETPGLLHSISTQRHTTFGDPRSDILRLQETLRLLLQTKCSHLTLGFLHCRSAKQALPTATAAPQPPSHGNIFFCSIIIWTLLCIHTDLPIPYVLTWPLEFLWPAPPRCQGLHDYHLILCLAGQTGCRWLQHTTR